MNMKIKIIAGVLSLFGMQYVVAADSKEDDIARRLAIHSNYYATALKLSKAANPAEYYNDFLKSTEKIEDIQFDSILEVFKNAKDDSEQGLLNGYTKWQNVIDDCSEKRAAIIELLKATDYLDIQAHALISACADDLIGEWKKQFLVGAQAIEWEADSLDVRQQRLMIGKMLEYYGYDLRNIFIQNMLPGHEGPVNSVAYGPDGSLLVSGLVSGSACTVVIWDMASGQLIRKLTGHNNVCPEDSPFDSVNIPQALYICYRLEGLRVSFLKEASSQEINENNSAESFSTRLGNSAAVSLLNLFGVDQLEGAVKLLGNEDLKFKEEARKSYLAQLHDSLPENIKNLLDKG